MKKNNIFFILVFLLPGVLIYSMFYIYPLLYGFKVTFYETTKTFLDTYVGFNNFRDLFGVEFFRSQFFNALGNNLLFLLMSLSGANILGLFFAYVLSLKRVKGAQIYRNILFAPQVIPIIAIGFVSILIFNPSLGTFDKIINLFHLPLVFTNLLGKTQTALITIACIEILRLLGFPLTIYYVSMINISDDIIGSAKIDGANDFNIFFKVVIPILAPIIVTTNILMMIGSFIYFDLVYVMQGFLGGPSFSTDVLGVYFKRITFGGHTQSPRPGMGAVIALCMFLILSIFTAIGLYTQKRMGRKLI